VEQGSRDFPLTDILSIIFTGIIVGVITALATAWLALRKTRSEGLWKQKFETYTSLFEAMNELMEQADQLSEAEMTGKEVPSQRRAVLAKSAEKATLQIKKISRIGSFLLSEQSQDIVIDLLKELDEAFRANSYFEHLDEKYGVLKRAVDRLRKSAKKDLKV
jgi:gas vesicle protein